MLAAILNFFGLGSKAKPDTVQPLTEGATKDPVKFQTETVARPAPPARPPIKKTSIRAKNYYRKNGKFYSSGSDDLIEDLMLLVVLSELFEDGDIREDFEPTVEEVVANAEPIEDLLDVDVSQTPVVEAPSYTPNEPSYTAPEPETTRYDSGSSYGSGSSDYDSGSSDSGGSDD